MKKQNSLIILLALMIIFTLGNNLIQSQNTLPTNNNEPEFFDEERPITYRRLNEVLKLANYKKLAEKKDSIQVEQMKLKDSIIGALNNIISKYEQNVIPSFEQQIDLLRQESVIDAELYSIKDEKWNLKYQKLKSKKIGIGLYAGYGLSPDGSGANAGIGIYYTLFRL